MQQAIYNNIATINTAALKTSRPGVGLVRWIARKWDLAGILTLMGSSAVYAVYALAHTGL